MDNAKPVERCEGEGEGVVLAGLMTRLYRKLSLAWFVVGFGWAVLRDSMKGRVC